MQVHVDLCVLSPRPRSSGPHGWLVLRPLQAAACSAAPSTGVGPVRVEPTWPTGTQTGGGPAAGCPDCSLEGEREREGIHVINVLPM